MININQLARAKDPIEMCEHEVLFSVLLFVFVGLTACGQSHKTQSAPKNGIQQGQFWEVKIEPSKATVKNDETFSVRATIGNTGKLEQMLIFTACGYPNQWKTDNAFVHVQAANCLMNPLARINVKAAGVYQMTVPVYVEFQPGAIKQDAITFRMGYANGVPSIAEMRVPDSQLFWSNAVTVSVTK